MTVLLALRKATTDSLTVVSVSTGAISHAVESIGNLAETGALHSAEYRDKTKVSIEIARAANLLEAKQTARLNVSRKLVAIQEELSSNPALSAIFNQIDDDLKVIPKVAA